jgi:gamma-glutamylcyclotransferase (GGCT)/AIG2-like uncharacterized protein YtfP
MNDTAGRVFVYGTLRRGASNHFRMNGARFLGEGRVAGWLLRIDWYPGLLLEHGTGEVVGEVFEVSPETLRELDAFESLVPGTLEGPEYRRVVTRVSMADGAAIDAWVWEWRGAVDPARRIANGDWLGQPCHPIKRGDHDEPRQA